MKSILFFLFIIFSFSAMAAEMPCSFMEHKVRERLDYLSASIHERVNDDVYMMNGYRSSNPQDHAVAAQAEERYRHRQNSTCQIESYTDQFLAETISACKFDMVEGICTFDYSTVSRVDRYQTRLTNLMGGLSELENLPTSNGPRAALERGVNIITPIKTGLESINQELEEFQGELVQVNTSCTNAVETNFMGESCVNSMRPGHTDSIIANQMIPVCFSAQVDELRQSITARMTGEAAKACSAIMNHEERVAQTRRVINMRRWTTEKINMLGAQLEHFNCGIRALSDDQENCTPPVAAAETE